MAEAEDGDSGLLREAGETVRGVGALEVIAVGEGEDDAATGRGGEIVGDVGKEIPEGIVLVRRRSGSSGWRSSRPGQR